MATEPVEVKEDQHTTETINRTESTMRPKKTKECDIFGEVWYRTKRAITRASNNYTQEDLDEFIDDIKACCNFQHDFDVYQVLAFESTNSDRDIVETWKYRMRCLKAFLCAITQIFAMTVVLYQLIGDGLQRKQWCGNFRVETWYMNVLAFLLSTYLAYTTIRELSSTKGLYGYILLKGYNAPWIDHGWLYFGFVINTIASVSAVWGSFFIIFFSEEAIDMVLNSVALFFIVELDDLLVDDEVYDDVLESIENGFPRRQKNKGILKKGCGPLCDKFVQLIIFFVGGPFTILRIFTIAACVFVPIYVGICF